MANSKVALMRRVKTASGWRYYPAAYSDNGRVKPGVAVVADREVKHPIGYYALRYCRGAEPIFEALKGVGPAEAETRRRKKEAQLAVVVAAGKADIKVERVDPQRRLFTSALKQFLDDTEARGSLEAAEVYKLPARNFDGSNKPYDYLYLYAYTLEVPANAKTITLPNNNRIRLLAITVAEENETLRTARPLYDTLSGPNEDQNQDTSVNPAHLLPRNQSRARIQTCGFLRGKTL